MNMTYLLFGVAIGAGIAYFRQKQSPKKAGAMGGGFGG
jgi:hypothetical protein